MIWFGQYYDTVDSSHDLPQYDTARDYNKPHSTIYHQRVLLNDYIPRYLHTHKTTYKRSSYDYSVQFVSFPNSDFQSSMSPPRSIFLLARSLTSNTPFPTDILNRASHNANTFEYEMSWIRQQSSRETRKKEEDSCITTGSIDSIASHPISRQKIHTHYETSTDPDRKRIGSGKKETKRERGKGRGQEG